MLSVKGLDSWGLLVRASASPEYTCGDRFLGYPWHPGCRQLFSWLLSRREHELTSRFPASHILAAWSDRNQGCLRWFYRRRWTRTGSSSSDQWRGSLVWCIGRLLWTHDNSQWPYAGHATQECQDWKAPPCLWGQCWLTRRREWHPPPSPKSGHNRSHWRWRKKSYWKCKCAFSFNPWGWVGRAFHLWCTWLLHEPSTQIRNKSLTASLPFRCYLSHFLSLPHIGFGIFRSSPSCLATPLWGDPQHFFLYSSHARAQHTQAILFSLSSTSSRIYTSLHRLFLFLRPVSQWFP